MGADWYYPQTWYGYSFLLPAKTSYATFMASVNPLCDFLPAPFQIVGVLESFHSRMEMDCSGMDDMAVVILAFPANKDLTQMVAWGKELAEFVQDSPVLLGLDLHPEPRFFSGIEWSPCEEEEDFDSSDSSTLAQSMESLGSVGSVGSVESSESSPSSSASFLSDHDDTHNYHGEDAVDAVDAVEAEAENYEGSDQE